MYAAYWKSFRHIGGLKKVQYSKLMAEHSDLAMTYAVKGMIPSNTIGAKALTRLHCYQGAEHAHAPRAEVVGFLNHAGAQQIEVRKIFMPISASSARSCL